MLTDYFLLDDDGVFPNSKLPLIVVQQAFVDVDPAQIETRFTGCDWPAAWRSGIFDFHHYHSTAHEALGAFSGRARLQFGGDNGVVLDVNPGDVVIIPAGVAHRCVDHTAGFCMVGAYPIGQSVDTCYGKPSERPDADRNIAALAVPLQDPVAGKSGPLCERWIIT